MGVAVCPKWVWLCVPSGCGRVSQVGVAVLASTSLSLFLPAPSGSESSDEEEDDDGDDYGFIKLRYLCLYELYEPLKGFDNCCFCFIQ